MANIEGSLVEDDVSSRSLLRNHSRREKKKRSSVVSEDPSTLSIPSGVPCIPLFVYYPLKCFLLLQSLRHSVIPIPDQGNGLSVSPMVQRFRHVVEGKESSVYAAKFIVTTFV
ncbi:hypothetical protein ACOSQ3_004945 [Xanthoceras sorbifolium]